MLFLYSCSKSAVGMLRRLIHRLRQSSVTSSETEMAAFHGMRLLYDASAKRLVIHVDEQDTSWTTLYLCVPAERMQCITCSGNEPIAPR